MTEEAETQLDVTSRFDSYTEEQFLRLYIFDNYADPQYDGPVMVQNMEAIYNWIREGKIPRKPHLKEVT